MYLTVCMHEALYAGYNTCALRQFRLSPLDVCIDLVELPKS
jgi:hypothetical protein